MDLQYVYSYLNGIFFRTSALRLQKKLCCNDIFVLFLTLLLKHLSFFAFPVKKAKNIAKRFHVKRFCFLPLQLLRRKYLALLR